MEKQLLNTEILDRITKLIDAATQSEANDPTASCLSTIGENGYPDSRMVLVRTIDENGFVFFTNHNSKKGQDLLAIPRAALCFHWKTLRAQLRIQGDAERASDDESDAYYNARARESRIGAWASDQSQILNDRVELIDRYNEFKARYETMENPPRPLHWGGFRIRPQRVEFWHDGDHRLHDRDVYELQNGNWVKFKLYP